MSAHDDTDEVLPKARASIHTTLLAWFAGQPRGKILDAPAGYGHLSLRLTELGFDVDAGEIEPEIFRVPDMTCVYTDLNRHIDAPDATYDYVCCVDGLEHMTDPYTAVRELARVLRPGGVGVFSIPNYSSIERRLKFLWYGYFTKPLTTAQYEAQGRTLFNFHNAILTITILDFMFRINGLAIEDLLSNAPKPRQRILWPLVALMRLWARLSSARSRIKRRTDLTLHPKVVMGGNNIIFITRRTPGGEPVQDRTG